MSKIVIFNQSNNRITECIKSANTPDYEGRTDVLVNPDLSLLSGVPRKYWKQSGGSIIEMTQAEKDALDLEVETKLKADNKLKSKLHFDEAHFKAFVNVLLNEINSIRKKLDLPNRTKQQLKNALNEEIDSGSDTGLSAITE